MEPTAQFRDWQSLWARLKDTPVVANSSLTVSRAGFILLVLSSALLVAMMMATGRMAFAVVGALGILVIGFGGVLVRQVRLEVLVGWLMIPIILAYPPSRSPIGPFPAPNSVRMFLVGLFAGLIFLNPASAEERKTSRMTTVFRITHLLLLLITGLSAAFVTAPINDPLGEWSNSMLLILMAGLLASYLKAPGMVLQAITAAARPLAIVLGLIAIVEYVLGASVYGIPIRIDGFDRRVPGPFFSAEVLGYFLSILTALVMFHLHRYPQSRSSRLLSNAALLFCLIGTILTFFRSGWFSLVIVWVVYLAFHLPSLERIKRFVQWLVLLSPAFVLAAALVVVTINDASRSVSQQLPFVNTLQDRLSGDASQNSAGNRATLAQSAWLMVQDSPITGVGYSQYPRQMLRYIPENLPSDQFEVIYKALDASDWQGKVAHNSYVQLVAECGIPALVLLVLIQILPMYALWVRRRQYFGRELLFLAIAVVASTAASFMWQSMLYYGEAALVWVALLLGVLMRSADPVTPQVEPEIGTSPDDIWSPPPA